MFVENLAPILAELCAETSLDPSLHHFGLQLRSQLVELHFAMAGPEAAAIRLNDAKAKGKQSRALVRVGTESSTWTPSWKP